MNKKGVSLIQILVLIIVFGVLIGGGFVLLNQEKAKTRDARRLSDIARLQAAFEFLYKDTASYAGAAEGGCDQLNMLASQCNLKNYVNNVSQFTDPGQSSYLVTKVPAEDGYEITFNLEKNYGSLKSGKHTLSPEGIN
ncbi:MAG: hypothetical protein WCV50_03605 [Patescibacteria group bacterium]|jgi:hypothetical protein